MKTKFLILPDQETGQIINQYPIQEDNPDARREFYFLIREESINLRTGRPTKLVFAIHDFDEGVVTRALNKVQSGAMDSMKLQQLKSFSPFYLRRDGTPQEPVLNPENGVFSLEQGRPYYTKTVLAPNSAPDELWVENAPLGDAAVEKAVVAKTFAE